MSSASYYLYQGGQPVGPFTIDQLKADWRQGKINEQTYYWVAGMDGWKALAEIQSQLKEPEPAPAPVPPPAPAVEEDTTDYYLFENNQQTGPFRISKLKERYKGGEINDATFFWRNGLDTWKPLKDISDKLKPKAEPAPASTLAASQPTGGSITQKTIQPGYHGVGGNENQITGPFKDFVQKDREALGDGPINPHDQNGPFYEILMDGRNSVRLSLEELRGGWRAGAIRGHLSYRSEGSSEWRSLEEMRDQLN